jgi:hypothetical protein
MRIAIALFDGTTSVCTGALVHAAAGVSAGIDMAPHLVVRLDAPDAARRTKREIQYDPDPPV